jgi:uracil-DNA glycosylase family 4
MDENPNCELCELHLSASPKSVCLKGEGGIAPKLVIYFDAPSIVDDRRGRAFVSEPAMLLKWMLRRMSIQLTEVYLDYVLKCYPTNCKTYTKKAYRQAYIEACSKYRVATLQLLRPAAIIAMGSKACEAFVGSDKVASFEGTYWTPQEPFVREVVDRVYITYSPAYALQDPAEIVSIYRTLEAAAIQANLKPKLANIPMYEFGT